MVAHFLETADASQDFRGLESRGQVFSLFLRTQKLATRHPCARAKHVRPPEKKNLHQSSTLPNVLTFRERFVVILALVEPGAVGCVPVTRLVALQGRGVLFLDRFPQLGEQAMETARELISRLDPLPLGARDVTE